MSKKHKHIQPFPHSQEQQVNIEQRETILRSVYEETQTFQKPHDRVSLVPIAVFAALIGLISGFLSILLFASGSLERIPYLRELNVRLLSSNAPITIERTEKVTVTANERTSELMKRIPPMLFGIYQASALTPDTEGLAHSLMPPLGTAVSVTSDGWLVTGFELGSMPQDYSVLNRNGDVFPVTAVVPDPAAGLSYLHIQSKDLPVATFPREAALSLVGADMIVPEFRVGNTPVPFSVTTGTLATPPIRSSDAFLTRIRLSLPRGDGMAGAPVMHINGNIIGIVAGISTPGPAVAIPAWHIGHALDQIAKEGKVTRPKLGVNYLELSSAARLKYSLLGERHSGAFLTPGNGAAPAVEPQSNAALAGLKSGDIITKVDDELVNDVTDLTYLIQSYKPDVKAKITFLRDGEEKVAEAALAPPTIQESSKPAPKNLPAKKK